MSPDRIVAFTDRCSRPYGEFPDRREVFAGLVETDQRTLILPTVDQPPGGSVLRPQLRGDRQDPRREDLAIVIAHFGANRTRRDAAERDRPPSVAPGVGLVLDGGPMRRDARKDRAHPFATPIRIPPSCRNARSRSVPSGDSISSRTNRPSSSRSIARR